MWPAVGNSTSVLWLSVVIGSTMAMAVRAEETDWRSDRQSFMTTLYFENDGTFVKPNHRHDRHYTSGMKITIAHQPRWATSLAARLPFNPAVATQELKTAVGYALGQNIYTPADIRVKTLIPDDRPYAGWLYGGVYLQRATEHLLDHFEINLGIIGPSSLAGHVQNEVHDLFDQIEPAGWNHQLGDEVGFDFIFNRKWKIPLLTQGGLDALQIIPQAGFTLGTVHRHAHLGVLMRVGVNLPDDFGPGRIEEPASATGAPQREPGAYLFVGATGKVIGHNTLLEGNNHRSNHGVAPETRFGQVRIGIVVYWDRFELGYSQTFQSREFSGQRAKDSFGALTLAWRGEF